MIGTQAGAAPDVHAAAAAREIGGDAAALVDATAIGDVTTGATGIGATDRGTSATARGTNVHGRAAAPKARAQVGVKVAAVRVVAQSRAVSRS
eukprot:SAG11_NODE_98_length_16927_cov_35.166211_6_plen_93_part_00